MWYFLSLFIQFIVDVAVTLHYREKPGDEHWKALDDRKIPLLLNYSQCKLLCKDYYPVIEHTTEVLKKDPGQHARH